MPTEDLEKRRIARLREFAIAQARHRFDADYPDFVPDEIVASICAYEEEGNIGDVLDKMPETIDGRPFTVFVVVDGGTDKTAEIARSFPGVKVFEFPVNLGHGVALQVTYRYCIEHGVKYVVTLDADGQNDPAEIPQILAPLLDDQADFVVGESRARRGQDDRRRAQERRSVLLLRDEPHDRREPHRHLDRIPGTARDDAGRRRRPSDPRAVPDGRAAHHRPEARLARQRGAHRVVPPRLGHHEEGQELALRLPLRARRLWHLVARALATRDADAPRRTPLRARRVALRSSR